MWRSFPRQNYASDKTESFDYQISRWTRARGILAQHRVYAAGDIRVNGLNVPTETEARGVLFYTRRGSSRRGPPTSRGAIPPFLSRPPKSLIVGLDKTADRIFIICNLHGDEKKKRIEREAPSLCVHHTKNKHKCHNSITTSHSTHVHINSKML